MVIIDVNDYAKLGMLVAFLPVIIIGAHAIVCGKTWLRGGHVYGLTARLVGLLWIVMVLLFMFLTTKQALLICGLLGLSALLTPIVIIRLIFESIKK